MKTRITPLLVVFVSILGCSRSSENDSASDSTTSEDPIVMDGLPPMLNGDSHPVQGPHGGELIELGQEDFHGELVHDQSGVAIFVLDSSATAPVSIASEKLTISLKHDGEVKSFDLVASPDADDPSGESSRFASADTQLGQWMDAGAEGAIVIQIDDKSYTGKIEHDHDYDHSDHVGHNH